MKKIVITIVVLISAGTALWYFAKPLKDFSKGLPEDVKNLTASSTIQKLQSLAQNISAPAPLVSNSNENGNLDNAGVIIWTNTNRQQNGNLPALKENAKLDQAAQVKLADMFKQQYFEHVNPQGIGPADLAKKAAYAYISEGENLALGNFKDDQTLLTAWMNSPGHRANILNAHYEEIGVAVGQGLYQGHTTWLAVQEFGRPASSCPSVDENLKAQINSLQAQADQELPQLQALKAQIDSANPHTQADYDAYNKNVSDYNALVKIYNNVVDSLKLVSGQYNAEVTAYNNCLAGSS